MKKFNTYENIPNMKPCFKKKIIISAVQINEHFKVMSLEGEVTGKPGDFLMKGIDGELYICEKSIFERSYEWA